MRRIAMIVALGALPFGLVLGLPASRSASAPTSRPAASIKTVQVMFLQPEGGKVTVTRPGGAASVVAIPGHVNFPDAQTYPLKLHDLPKQKGVVVWGRLTVEPLTDYTLDCAVPLEITRDDIEDAKRNVLVVKVVFLPDQKHQVYAIPGAPTSIVSTRLEPGRDAVEEARKQGTILLILRLGGRQYGSTRPTAG